MDSATLHYSHPSIRLALMCTALCFLGLSGCSQILKLSQSPDGDAALLSDLDSNTKYIGSFTDPYGLATTKVDAVGLITELSGTGGDPLTSPQRNYLIKEINTHQISDVKGLLAGSDTSLVVVTGFIPPAARKGDRFDLKIQCLPKTETESLNGGFLMAARMKPMLQTTRSVKFGHNIGLAKGRIVTHDLINSNANSKSATSGIIVGGGTVTQETDTGLWVPIDLRSIQTVTAISRAINGRFAASGVTSGEYVATPKTDRAIVLLIPKRYQANPGRFFNVVLNIAFEENGTDSVNRLEKLERQLHREETVEMAAIRLEGMGEQAIPALKRGLRSDVLATRFHSAEALAYLDDESGMETLRTAVTAGPAYRWHGLKSLESLDTELAKQTLNDLIENDSDYSTRYGAFQALLKSHRHSLTPFGESIGEEFDLFEVESKSEPFIHFSLSHHPEIVLFGVDQRFDSSWLYIEAGLTIKALDENTIQIKRFRPNASEQTRTCSTRVRDVIRELGKIGYDYSALLTILKDAKESEAISYRLLLDAAPRLNQSYRYVDNPSDLVPEWPMEKQTSL